MLLCEVASLRSTSDPRLRSIVLSTSPFGLRKTSRPMGFFARQIAPSGPRGWGWPRQEETFQLHLKWGSSTVVVWDIPLIGLGDIMYWSWGLGTLVQRAPEAPRGPERRKDGNIMPTTVVKEYDAHIDIKKRVTLRGAEAEYYAVRMFDDGHIVLEPRVLVPPEMISKRTLKMLDTAAANFKKGKVSKPIDLDRYL